MLKFLLLIANWNAAALAVSQLILKLQRLTDSVTLDPVIAPIPSNGPANVTVETIINAIGGINARRNTFSVTVEVRVRWKLPEEMFNSSIIDELQSSSAFPGVNLTTNEIIFSVSRAQEKMWTPKFVPLNALNLHGKQN